jgi:Ca-activated chloride channel family protein
MKFFELKYLFMFWVIPVLIFFYVYAFKKKDELIRLFCEEKLIDRIMPDVNRGRQKLKAFLIVLGVIFIITALLKPRWGYHWEELKRRGVDLVVAVDLSNSMLAEDVKPNRLKRAKMEIEDLINIIQGDRVGLVAFAGESFLQCPLTLDYSAFNMFLDYLDTDFIPVQGTAMDKALKTAVKALESKEKKSKAIILITDGEDHTGNSLKEAEEAKKKGIKIFTIGIGGKGGAPIPAAGGSGGFKKDKAGQLVMTTLDESTLQKIALITGGKYVRSITGDMDLEKIYVEGIKEELEDKELKSQRIKRFEERFQIFIGFAIFFIVLECFLSEKKKRVGVYEKDYS